MSKLHTLLGYVGTLASFLAPALLPAVHGYLVAHPAIGGIVTTLGAACATLAATGPSLTAPTQS